MRMHPNHATDVKKRLYVSLALSAGVLIATIFPFFGSDYLVLALSTVIYFYGGYPFLKGLKDELSQYKPGMMTLIGIAITVSCVYSAYLVLIHAYAGRMTFFPELVTLIDVMLLGHWLELHSVKTASSAVESLGHLLPAEAHVIEKNGLVKDIPIAEVLKGMHVLVKPGEKISADGTVIAGESEINEALLTGESAPLFKRVGDYVIAGGLNGNGALTITVSKDQKENYVAQVIKLVGSVLEGKSSAQDRADRAAFFLTIIALVGGLSAFLFWYFRSNLASASEHFVSVLVTACPHALGLAIPLVIVGVTALAARQGILIRNRQAFERADELDLVVFDKTGTLTLGKLEITDVWSLGRLSERELLTLAASVEQFGQHAIAKAILEKAQARNITIPQAESAHTEPGKQASALINGREIIVGNPSLIEMESFDSKITTDNKMQARAAVEAFQRQGKTVVVIMSPDRLEGVLAAADTIRPEAKKACAALKKRGIELALITGDNERAARFVAQSLGIEVVHAQLLPHQKAAILNTMRRAHTVAMVGDGINDAPALAAADIGIAVGAGTDVAIETADIVLVSNDLSEVGEIINLAKLSRRKIRQNIGWATGYNAIALPIAAGVFEPFGLTLPPTIGALLMALSTVIVALNSYFIWRKRF